MTSFRYPLLVLVVLFLAACSSSGGDDMDPPPPPTGGGDDDPVEIPDPTSATLVFPEDNTECNEGIPVNDAQSEVTFEWNASQNTDSYTVTVTNLNDDSTFNTVTNSTTATITIDRGTPYEWFVTSRANGTTATAQSATWRFYNEGPGIENYAPFPAEAVNPTRGATLPSSTTSLVLEWAASDVDGDIQDFEVFFGEQGANLASLGVITETTLAVAVASSTIYEWRVVVTDTQNNTSTSETFLFRVE